MFMLDWHFLFLFTKNKNLLTEKKKFFGLTVKKSLFSYREFETGQYAPLAFPKKIAKGCVAFTQFVVMYSYEYSQPRLLILRTKHHI